MVYFNPVTWDIRIVYFNPVNRYPLYCYTLKGNYRDLLYAVFKVKEFGPFVWPKVQRKAPSIS